MMCLTLSPEDKACLDQARRTRPQIAERCHYVLLNAEGWSVPHIAQRLDRNEHTVRTWLKAYQTAGLQGLENTPHPGRPATKGQGVSVQLERLLAHRPSHFGYIEDAWTVDLLRHELAQKMGDVSDATVRRQLQAGGWVYKRFAKTVPRNALSSEKKKARVAEIVATIQAHQTERSVEVVWVDESHFTNAPYVRRGWFRKGTQVKVPTPATRQSATLFGALHLRTQRFYWKRAQRGTSQTFLAFLHQLHQRFPEVLLIVILDNAKIHKSRAVKRFLTQHPWVILEHLAPYSPEHNPIERFWQWLKAKVYGATAFDTIEDVLRKVRQLIWHYNEGWLTSTIHFDFILYQEIL
jgi:transposase